MNALLLAALLVAAPAAGAPVEIQIALRASTFWVGEALRMEVHWKALEPATVAVEREDLCFGSVRLLVRGARGERTYRERNPEFCEDTRAPRRMKQGEATRTRLLFFGIGGWLEGDIRSTKFEPSIIFSQPGEYTLRLAYIGDETDVLSNEVNVTVEMPPSEEEPLLREILVQPVIAYAAGDWPERVRRYPAARYLAWSRLAHFSEKVYHHVSRDAGAEGQRRLDIVSEILAQDWGQFEEDALALAYRALPGSKATGPAAEIAARLRAKFPGSWTVQQLGLDEPDEAQDEPGSKKP